MHLFRKEDGGLSSFDECLMNEPFTAFAKKHRIFTAVIIPLLVYFLYKTSSTIVATILVHVDTYTLTVCMDIIFGAMLLLYCSAIGLHIPNIRQTLPIPRWLLVVLVAFASVFVIVVGESAANLIIINDPNSGYTNYTTQLQTIPYAIVILLQVVVAPIMEELMFRKCMFGSFSRVMSPVIAALISSSLFALGHSMVAQWAMTFLLGMLNCWLYARFGRIIIPIAVHMSSNAIATFLGGIMLPSIFDNGVFDIVMYAICLALLGIALSHQPRAIAGYYLITP